MNYRVLLLCFLGMPLFPGDATCNQLSMPLPSKVRAVHFTVTNNNSHHIELNSRMTHTMPVSQPQSQAAPYAAAHQGALEGLCNYKNVLIGGALSAVGCYYLGTLIMIYRSLSNEHNWSLWKSHIALELLLKASNKETAHALFSDIQSRYVHSQHGVGLLDPIVSFLNDVNTELHQLEVACKWYAWLDVAPLSYIFSNRQQAVKGLQERIERLSFLKQLLVSWMSEYKVSHA